MKLENNRKKLFQLMSKYTVDLIKAEEAYLKAGGWTLVAIDGTHSTWSNHRYTGMVYSRTHALLLSKMEDQNLGIH